MCREERQFCKTCLGNDCNRKLEYTSCYTCDSAIDDYCIETNEVTANKQCRNYLDQCYTLIGENERVIRGCLEDAPTLALTCINNSKCELCTDGEHCNNKNVAQEFCYVCNSENDENCKNNPDAAMAQACTAVEYNFDRMGCYRFDDTGMVFIYRLCIIFILLTCNCIT